jgi:serine protease inhibitor
VCLAIYNKKKYLKAKEELWIVQKYDLPKNPLKETKNPSRYYNSITNLKFQHKLKSHLSKILI